MGSRTRASLRPHQVDRLRRALSHIENNVGTRATLRELARVAAIAPHHFHRLFGRFTGESVQAHVRRLRLERAAFELFTSDTNVAHIARRCGYESPAGFARAFTRHFGVTARYFRRTWTAPGYMVGIAPDLRRAFAQAPVEMCDEPDKRLKYLRRHGPLMPAVHAGHEAVQRLLDGSSRVTDTAIYKRTPDFPPVTPPDQLRTDTGFAYDCPHHPSDELAEQTLRGGRYAVFHLGAGAEAEEVIVQLWNYVYLVWAPQHRMQIRSFGAYGIYRRREGHAFRVELHVPVHPRDDAEGEDGDIESAPVQLPHVFRARHSPNPHEPA